MPTYITLPSLSANKVLTACYINLLNDDLRVIGTHGHSGCLGDGSASITSSSAASPFAYRYEVPAHIAPSQTSWSTLVGAAYIFGVQMGKTLANAASLKFPIGLYRGTHEIFVMYDDSVASGSTKILIDGTQVASITTNGGGQNTVCRITGISLTSTGSKVLEFNTAANTNFRLAAWKIRWTGD